MTLLPIGARGPESQRSEVRRFRLRHRIFGKTEEFPIVLVIFGAHRFQDRAIPLGPTHQARPGRVECARIVKRHGRFDRVSAIDNLPTFHRVKVLRVRRAPIVNEAVRMLGEADGVDDELSVLVPSNGFTEPTGFRVEAMLPIKIGSGARDDLAAKESRSGAASERSRWARR